MAHYAAVDEDPFDTLLNLETTYEDQGLADGLRAGKAQALTSATLFGIEQGFQKYIVLSRLRYRAEKWARMYNVPYLSGSACEGRSSRDEAAEPKGRLQKHIKTLLTLTSAQTLDYSNTDGAIGDFEERLKRANAKCKVIERMIGGGGGGRNGNGEEAADVVGDGDIEDPKLNLRALRLRKDDQG